MADHKWVPSRLGHGEQMCAKCFGTNRELAALGELNFCSVEDAPAPAAEVEGPGRSEAEHANQTVMREEI